MNNFWNKKSQNVIENVILLIMEKLFNDEIWNPNSSLKWKNVL